MPSAYLKDYEVEEQLLPDLCLRCGEPATVHRSKKFAWHPPWVIAIIVVALLPGLIVALVLTKRMRVSAPLCDRHKGHWSMRTAIILVGLVQTQQAVRAAGVGCVE